MNNSIEKEKQWIYLIFFLIGILSFPISQYLEEVFGRPFFQFFFLFLVYTILFTIGLSFFKERTFRFALKAFVLTFVASIFILVVGLIAGMPLGSLILYSLLGGHGIGYIYELMIGPFIIFLILFSVGIYKFKDRPLINFSIKAFAVSFTTLFLIASGWFILSYLGGGSGLSIGAQGIYPSGEKIIEITDEELDEYPLLREAINEYEINRNQLSDIDPNQWGRTRDFIVKKQQSGQFLFSITDTELEKELPLTSWNRSTSPMELRNVPVKLKNIFRSNGLNISEYAFIVNLSAEFKSPYTPIELYGRWDIFENQYLFSIMDAKLEEDLNRVPYEMGGELREEDINKIVKIKDFFESKGLSLFEKHWIRRSPENWVIIEAGGGRKVYEIWKEKGTLNVYTPHEMIYEIRKENGKLNVYDKPGGVGVPVFKVGDKYYKFYFGQP